MGIFDIYGLFDKFGIWGLVLGTFGIFYFFECKRKCSTFMGHLMELSPVWLTASLKCMGSLFAVFRVQQNPENGFQNSTIFRDKIKVFVGVFVCGPFIKLQVEFAAHI